jgi:hypothetical protein
VTQSDCLKYVLLNSALTFSYITFIPFILLHVCRSISLAGNPIGVDGVRSVIRLYLTDTQQVSVDISGVDMDKEQPGIFDPIIPDGLYVLDMADSYGSSTSLYAYFERSCLHYVFALFDGCDTSVP